MEGSSEQLNEIRKRANSNIGGKSIKKKPAFSVLQLPHTSGGSDASSIDVLSSRGGKNTGSFASWRRFYINEDNETFYLRWKEFFCFALCIRINVAYLEDHIFLLTNYGPTVTLLVITGLSIFLGLPLLVIYIFLGNYSSRNYIRLWDFVPLLKGIPYTATYYILTTNMYTVAYTALAGRYVKELIVSGDIPWLNCQYKGAHPDCVPTLAPINKSYDEECCNIQKPNCTIEFNIGKSPYDAVRDFYNIMTNMKADESPRKMGLMWEWILFDGFIYLLVFALAYVGLQKYRKYFYIILIVMNCSMLPCFLITLYYGPQVTSPGEMSQYGDLITYNYWRDVIAQSVHMELPVEVINFAASSPLMIGPTSSAVMIYIGFITANCLITVWVYMMFQIFKMNYKIRDYRCLNLKGRTFIFVHTADVLSRQYLSYELMIIYFLSVWTWGMICTVLRYTAVVDAIIDEFNWMKRYRVYIAAGLTGAMFVFSASRLRDHFPTQYGYIKTTVAFVKFILFFCIAQGLIIYSAERISCDYQFTYNTRISSFLINGLKQFLLTSTICIVMAFNFSDPMLVNFPVYIMCLLPIPVWMIIVTVQYFLKTRTSVMDADLDWGTLSRTMRYERRWYDHTHALRLRNSAVNCKHKCLLASANVKNEMSIWSTNQEMMREHFEEMAEDKHATLYTNLDKRDESWEKELLLK